MSNPELNTIKTAAKQLGVPATELLESAKEHGFLVKIGKRTTRLEKSSLTELVKACRENPKAHACIPGKQKTNAGQSMSSATAEKSTQRAQRI
ncbi:hypothetical protein [Roseovarius atlanticus]|uniref:hypothetical protein n=1 Tax=Roseovarius atlanticus TaxID=1641875 RepID=UPI00118737FB|nr:hypothetical protein [Roseovarius atlanticus]